LSQVEDKGDLLEDEKVKKVQRGFTKKKKK